MTFIKINKSPRLRREASHLAPRKFSNKKAQSIFEYVILTAIVAAVVLLFAATPWFTNIKQYCNNAFNRSVTQIVK